jgi:hypothetical protein
MVSQARRFQPSSSSQSGRSISFRLVLFSCRKSSCLFHREKESDTTHQGTSSAFTDDDDPPAQKQPIQTQQTEANWFWFFSRTAGVGIQSTTRVRFCSLPLEVPTIAIRAAHASETDRDG